MRVITEAVLRDELRAGKPESYTILPGKILSPAAREYLQQYKIKIIDESRKPSRYGQVTEHKLSLAEQVQHVPKKNNSNELPPEERIAEPINPQYVDFEKGAFYFEKPEHMTQLYGNVLVVKDHRRILFRGKLDSLEALFVLNQTILFEMGGTDKLLADLSDILGGLREMMRCDVLNEPFRKEFLIGLTHQELREHSHNPMKYYKVEQMVLPDYTLGKAYALLNQLRAAVRETECAAVQAFFDGRSYEREDITTELNRMSSAMHIMMCKYLAGDYQS
jgi:ethanolamine utilization cobalamin adenosyltransferase